ncbi:hypothetical protein [Rhodocyclus tenuis]|uniref:hypothetical protein n=1 Tax=Rhodocyclus tenuis TaxID=1066 RepID=UPI0019048C26|nr:hypothetical protein [Rhodocyclus tenuis]
MNRAGTTQRRRTSRKEQPLPATRQRDCQSLMKLLLREKHDCPSFPFVTENLLSLIQWSYREQAERIRSGAPDEAMFVTTYS